MATHARQRLASCVAVSLASSPLGAGRGDAAEVGGAAGAAIVVNERTTEKTAERTTPPRV
jgi:hypothetical protein